MRNLIKVKLCIATYNVINISRSILGSFTVIVNYDV